jgi:hypothetical protein
MRYEEFVCGIERYEQMHEYEERSAPWSYLKTIEKIGDVRKNFLLGRVEDNTLRLKEIIRPFLAHWGNVGRVVEQATDRDWETLMVMLWNLDAKRQFERLMEKVGDTMIRRELMTIDFDEEQEVANAVRTIFGKVQLVPHLGDPTCISIILHILNPYFFAMWDSEIRRIYKEKWGFLISETAEGYLEFLTAVKTELKEALGDYYIHAPMIKSYVELTDGKKLEALERAEWACESCGCRLGLCIDPVPHCPYPEVRVLCHKCKLLSDHENKSLVKLVDEYNWSVVHNK